VAHGRFYNDNDVKMTADVCLIGQTVRQKLFPNMENPVGQWLRVDRVRLRVIGVLGLKGRSPTGADQDDQIFVPITTLQHKLVGKEQVELIVAGARSQEVLAKAQEQITQILRRLHRLKSGEANNFDVGSVREMAELAEILAGTMQALVGIIASISLVVGGIGIMNIMLVSVTERTREIGIRMAVGATPRDVLMQFLIEATMLATAGGLAGIGLGIAGSMVLADMAQWPVVISPGVVLLAVLVSAGVGIFFGFYPALKASRLDPIDALRYE
jgi:putative ABC transport system permease protein